MPGAITGWHGSFSFGKRAATVITWAGSSIIAYCTCGCYAANNRWIERQRLHIRLIKLYVRSCSLLDERECVYCRKRVLRDFNTVISGNIQRFEVCNLSASSGWNLLLGQIHEKNYRKTLGVKLKVNTHNS